MSNGRLHWLPSALTNAGLRVNTVGGWESRGTSTMHPQVVVLHHTAAPMGRNAPSLSVCIDGRSDLPGPLCHVLIGRDATCHVIASGKANHAGTGSWRGVTGNSHAIGIEVENVGTPAEPWRDELVDAMIRAAAACAREAGIPPSMVCGHKEWAPRRKIDPHSLSMDLIRQRIAPTVDPRPALPEDPMAYQLDIGKYVDDCYDEAGRGGDQEGRNYWALTIAEADDPKAVINWMRAGDLSNKMLGLKPIA